MEVDGVVQEIDPGSTVATVNGVGKTLDVAPVISNERTFMPLRFVAENLGLKAGRIQE